jgi:hypothetical protein
MAVSGGSPSFTTITTTSDATISGLTVGKGAGADSTSTAVGSGALATSGGSTNTAVGFYALNANSSGTANTSIGRNTLLANTSGGSNVAVGHQALTSNTTSSNNTALGYQAGYGVSTSGSTPNTTSVGYQALYTGGGGGDTAIGYRAMYTANTSSGASVAVGVNSLLSCTTGFYNVAVGHNSAQATTTGTSNTAIGKDALYANTTASSNTGVGYQALYAMTTGGGCTALGSGAGQNINNANGQFTAIGVNAGSNVTTGGFGTYIGYAVQASSASVNSEYVIGNSITGKGGGTFYIAGTPYNSANQSAFSTTSDQRLKKNIVDNTEGLSIISQIRVRNFEYRTAEEVTELPTHAVIDKQGVQLGVIAQELQEVCGDCVKEESTGVLSVNSDNLTWHMINAIKDLKAELDTVKAELAALKG